MIIMILFLIIIAQAGCVHADPSFQFSYFGWHTLLYFHLKGRCWIESSFKSFPVKISSFLSVCKECQGSLLNQMWRMRTLMASKIAEVNSQNMKWHFVKWRVQYALSVSAGVAHLLNVRSTAISFDKIWIYPIFLLEINSQVFWL